MPGTVTQVAEGKIGPIRRITLTATADAAAATYPDTAITEKFNGELLMLLTNPGTTGPTNLYDIVIENADGADILGGAGADRSITASEIAAPVIGTYFRPFVSKTDTLTLKITNNAVNSAVTVITLVYRDMG